MLGLLTDLGEASLMKQFIAEVVTRDYDGSENGALVTGARLLGAKQTGKLYAELARHHTAHRHGHCVDLLRALTARRETAGQEWQEALRQIAKAVVSGLDAIGREQGDLEWPDSEEPEKNLHH